MCGNSATIAYAHRLKLSQLLRLRLLHRTVRSRGFHAALLWLTHCQMRATSQCIPVPVSSVCISLHCCMHCLQGMLLVRHGHALALVPGWSGWSCVTRRLTLMTHRERPQNVWPNWQADMTFATATMLTCILLHALSSLLPCNACNGGDSTSTWCHCMHCIFADWRGREQQQSHVAVACSP